MIQFQKLRLSGFKSFVERTEMDIGPGLTGIVGPNGCGKSNVVEALRWSMGETSAKKMRGGSGSMDDVIFNGTEKRPARNMAEVIITLDNTRRTAPAPYNNSDDIEVVRKIEREHGSSYRINGKPVRARDVQLLYADVMSGAHSPYLVSQGKVTTMINAKPLERRMILEEAAGVGGLYARRHEAEIRLRATDTNLKRVEDIVGSMDTRLQALKRQARQASKYRNLSAQIRQLEMMIAGMEWTAAHERLSEIRRKFGEEESRVAERLVVVTQLTKTQTVQAQDLPELREADAKMGAALQAQKIALTRVEDESTRIDHDIKQTLDQLRQLIADQAHEQQALKENETILTRLEEEEKSILSKQSGDDETLETREKVREEAQAKVKELEAQTNALMEKIAGDRARRSALEQQVTTDTNRLNATRSRLSTVREQLAAKRADAEKAAPVEEMRTALEKLEQEAQNHRTLLERLDKDVSAARESRETARVTLQEANTKKSKLESEIATIESVLSMYDDGDFRPILDDIETESGFETALSRALGDALMASLESDAPVVWQKRDLKDLPELPKGAESLQGRVKGADVLQLALSQIGVVETIGDGDHLAPALKAGQSLVSKDGAIWRWDGLHAKATANDRNAVQLQQKNKLQGLQKSLPDLMKSVQKADEALKTANENLAAFEKQRSETQSAIQQGDNILRQKRNELNATIESQSKLRAELSRLEEALSLAEIDLQGIETTIAGNKTALEAFDEAKLAAQQQEVDSSRATLSKAREELQNAIRDSDTARQDQSRRKARLRAIGDERVNLHNRCIRSRERVKEFSERHTTLTQKRDDLTQRPASLKADREMLLSKIGTAEQEKAVVSDKLAICESELAETTKALKQAESELSEAREARAHAQATVAERQQRLEAATQSIRETFDLSPEELLGQAALSDESMPDLDALKQQREQAVRERDMLGPVNLQADTEAETLEAELGTILHERNDLIQAVTELREGIQKLNKEARERLNVAFERVNAHFREMFTRLFSGGQAHLSLIESEDPLEAGLEIFAQPPGKALQSLSLLSGGEQTMTALALIFAMFMTNPGPICVLDEVDAPLDDANVDRMCDMLEEFAERGETRFLVITHHRLTMARMDRLYGVTMSERGVSQLVSVDLSQSTFDFLDKAA